MKFNEAIKYCTEASDKYFQQWKDNIEKVYREKDVVKLSDIGDLKIRFKKKKLKSDGLSVNGGKQFKSKTELTWNDYKVIEDVYMTRKPNGHWKDRNEKTYKVYKGDKFIDSFHVMRDVKDEIKNIERMEIVKRIREENK
jgi:hypothetical protein